MISPFKNLVPKVGLIGVSGYAAVYVDWLLQAHADGKLRLRAVVAIREDRSHPNVGRIEELGVPLYESYPEMFAAQSGMLDLCLIPTGINWHARMTIAALRAGCNVLVEKPLAGSVADARAILQAEKETARWVAVGFQDMYSQAIIDLKRSLLAGRLGKLKSVSVMGAWPRTEEYFGRNQWAGKLQSEGVQVLDSPLNNAFAHFVNIALYLAGPDLHAAETASVTHSDLWRARNIESFDTAVVIAKSASGIDFWFGVTHSCSRTKEPSIRIVGDRGELEWTHEAVCKIQTQDGPDESWQVPRYGPTRQRMFDSVLGRITNPNTTICSTATALCHTSLIESIHKTGTIRSVHPSLITQVQDPNSQSTVPVIAGIEDLLEASWRDLAPLREDLAVNSLEVQTKL